MTSIEVRGLVKRYRGTAVPAVDDVSFDVREGELFSLLGPNGAGKTTVLSILTTILAPTAGTVRVAGLDLARERSAVRGVIGVVFQQPALDMNLTGEENLRLHAVLYGLYPWRPSHRLMPAPYRRQVEELSALVGAGDAMGRAVRTLSGGTRRKLEMARALMHRPRLLFLDEPTAGLDPETRRGLWSHLRRICDGQATTVFLTTHLLQEAEAADTVCIMAAGRVIATGAPAAVKARAAEATLEDAFLRLVSPA